MPLAVKALEGADDTPPLASGAASSMRRCTYDRPSPLAVSSSRAMPAAHTRASLHAPALLARVPCSEKAPTGIARGSHNYLCNCAALAPRASDRCTGMSQVLLVQRRCVERQQSG